MGNLTLLEILKQSFTLVILLFCSLLSIIFMVERWVYFRSARLAVDDLLRRVGALLEAGDLKQAQSLCQSIKSPVARLAHYALLQHGRSRAEIEELMESKKLEERVKMERYLGVLGTLGNTAPFIGLFGTVLGIIRAFEDLALSGSGGPTVVAKGIAEALVATAAGLAVAIPAVIAYNYFVKKVKVISTEMDVMGIRLLSLIKQGAQEKT
ncbi:MAG: MotA/TolQ/ExbB proton channel family protein [Elusimicrobia bacterium]|nr:MotA/TolQ/ExbB proton channel family protein [Elusimicrobiota bacterium]